MFALSTRWNWLEIDHQEVCLCWCPRTVFHLFSQVIPQSGLSRMENGRKRIAIVPDFKFPGWGAGEETFLAELKGISSDKSRYPRNPGRPLELWTGGLLVRQPSMRGRQESATQSNVGQCLDKSDQFWPSFNFLAR